MRSITTYKTKAHLDHPKDAEVNGHSHKCDNPSNGGDETSEEESDAVTCQCNQECEEGKTGGDRMQNEGSCEDVNGRIVVGFTRRLTD